MDSNITLILTLSLILVFSPYLSTFLKLPTAPIEIILGSLLAPLGLIIAGGGDAKVYFDLMAEVGFLYLMFLAGLEVNLKSIIKMPKDYTIKALIFLAILAASTILLGHFILGLNPIVTAALPLISIGLLASLSKEYGKNTEWIKVALYVGAIGEVLSITVLTILEVSVALGFSEALFYKILLLVGFLGIVLGLYYFFRLIFWWFPELKAKMMPHANEKDQDLRLAMGIFFMMIVIMQGLYLELAFGAFIAGLFISTFFHHKRELEHKMSSFGFGFLVPIFFIHVGASFDYAYFSDVIGTAIKILIVMIVVRLMASSALVKLIGYKDATLVALSLSMPLTLLVATATVGHHHGILDEHNYYAIILASLLEVIFFMIAIKFIAKR
ncbi:MAG: cation:proton antiporter [Epsilonproteobacteria bacterium]|nr:cation:proton antiporter [Campylobacterota bacterium]